MQNFKSGKYINQGYYKSFQPELINKEWLLGDMEILNLLSKADRHLGRLDIYSNHIPDIDLFISKGFAGLSGAIQNNIELPMGRKNPGYQITPKSLPVL